MLLTYLAEGLDVSGSDISRDMLTACRQDAARLGLEPTLYEQPMQELAVPGRFRTIYIPCGSFSCIMDRQEALQTLRRCHDHLAVGGALAFNVFPVGINYAEPPADNFPTPWAPAIQVDLPDGVTVTGDFTPAQFGPEHDYTMAITAVRRYCATGANSSSWMLSWSRKTRTEA